MSEERSWRVEIKWWISAFAALLATLAIFALILAVISLATTSQADLAKAGIADPLGDVIGKATVWPIDEVFVFPTFMFAAALGFRLLVPTFAGVPPRTMAVIVMSPPIGLGSLIVSGDVPFSLFLVAMAIVWALVMPMPKRTVLTDNPVKGGIIVGLTLGALSPYLTLILAIAWCSVRLYRRKSLEVAATAMCAAIVPAMFLASQLRQGTRSASAVEITIEVLILAALSLAGFIRWEFFSGEDEDEGEAEGQDADADAVAAEVTEPTES